MTDSSGDKKITDLVDGETQEFAEKPRDDGKNENGNSGFDIFRFIRRQLNQPPCFRKLLRDYTDGISEKNEMYWCLFVPCFLLDVAYYIILHTLMLATLLAVVYGLVKIVGLDQFLLTLLGAKGVVTI